MGAGDVGGDGQAQAHPFLSLVLVARGVQAGKGLQRLAAAFGGDAGPVVLDREKGSAVLVAAGAWRGLEQRRDAGARAGLLTDFTGQAPGTVIAVTRGGVPAALESFRVAESTLKELGVDV